MATSHETTAEIAFTLCDSCYRRQLETDKYCRHCGISRHRPGYNTRPLSGPTHDITSFTNPIIKVVTAELDQLPVSVRNNPWAMRLISTVIAIPIWIIIVMLSPINAYVAIRAIARQG